MALVQPTNLFPSSFRGSGGDVIDASVDNTFSLQLNGTSACVAYALEIMQNDTESTSVYTISKTTLSSAIYPRNYLNEAQRLEITIPSTSGMVNGYSNGYKWNVTLYWGSATEDECITSADTFFLAQEEPSLAIDTSVFEDDDGYYITEKSVTIPATYTQSDDIPIEWYRFVLTDSSGNTIDDSGEVYSSQIQFAVDGLLNGETYTVTLSGETQSGVTIDTVTLDFSVEYDEPSVSGIINTSCDAKSGSITLEFPLLRVITGEASEGTYTYVDDLPNDDDVCIEIPDGETITFDTVNGESMDFDEDSTHIWSGRPVDSGDLYTFTGSEYGDGVLSFDGTNLTYTFNGTEILSVAKSDFAIRWVIVIMYQDTCIMQFWVYSDVLLPSTTLYPSSTLYPQGDMSTWVDDGRYSA